VIGNSLFDGNNRSSFPIPQLIFVFSHSKHQCQAQNEDYGRYLQSHESPPATPCANNINQETGVNFAVLHPIKNPRREAPSGAPD